MPPNPTHWTLSGHPKGFRAPETSGSAILRTDSSQVRLACQKANQNKGTASFFILLMTQRPLLLGNSSLSALLTPLVKTLIAGWTLGTGRCGFTEQPQQSSSGLRAFRLNILQSGSHLQTYSSFRLGFALHPLGSTACHRGEPGMDRNIAAFPAGHGGQRGSALTTSSCLDRHSILLPTAASTKITFYKSKMQWK